MINDFFVFIIGLVILFIGLYLFIYSFSISSKLKKSEGWPYVYGTIVTNEAISFSATTENYNLDLLYNYTVSEKSYTGNQATMYSLTTKKEVKNLVNKYPKGSKVKVYYEPSRPENSVLEVGARKEKKNHELAMAFIVLYIGVMLCFIKYEGFLSLLPEYLNYFK